jgi:hypothetical protein
MKTSMGVADFSFVHQRRVDPSLGDPLKFLDLARGLGAGGIQTSLGKLDDARGAELRAKADAAGMWIEGSEALPRGKDDLERFERALLGMKAAGATAFRTVLLSGRRYESFETEDGWPKFVADARARLQLAEPLLAKHRIVAMFENHKDFRVPELLPFLKAVGSEWVAVCADFANNFTLLEIDEEVVEALAPVSAGAHVKDLAVGAHEEGFLAADVALGAGIHDLPRMIGALRKAKPGMRLCLEMSTRDPLKVPVFGRKYWASMKDVPASDLARILKVVRERGVPRDKLPVVDALAPEERAKLEAAAIASSLAYAGDVLKV